MYEELIENDIFLDIEKPKEYNLILWNDDTTYAKTVVRVLMQVIGFNEQKAVKYMMIANDCGKCSLGVYSYEIAETLMIESMRYVHSEGYHDCRMTVEEA